MKTLDLMEYVDENWRVELNNNFKGDLIKKVKQKFSIQGSSTLTSRSLDSIHKFHQGRYNSNLKYILKMCSLVKISQEELFKNIKGIYSCSTGRDFKIQKITIDKEFTQWYGAWIGDGDHSPKREAISLTNYEVQLLKLHIETIERFGFDKSQIKVEVITNKKEPKKSIQKRWSKILKLPFMNIITVTFMENATQEGARVQVWCTALFRILHQADKEIKQIIKHSSSDIQLGYIQGIFAAEGSVRKKGKQVRLNMKDKAELQFAGDILNELSINSTLIFNKTNSCFELFICGYDNIKKFKDLDGFALHSERKNLLNKSFKTYENKLPYHVRLEGIKKILLKKKTATNKELAKVFGLHQRHMSWITKHYADEGNLTVDKSSKIYKYSLAEF